MPDPSAIVRSRRLRQLDQRRARLSGFKRTGLGLGIISSILLAVLILLGALAYADLTRDLPNVALLPTLLNPPDGLLLQPTRVYDRTGEHLLITFAPGLPSGGGAAGDSDGLRRYIPLSTASPQHLPSFLPKATVVLTDPGFWTHGGYRLSGLNDPDTHPTIAQKLVSDLLLYGEKPSLRRALRERMLAAQVTSEYGRDQVLEWYLNSADYGNYAYGIDAAAELYFNKPATDLTPAESAILAATSQAPGLNPLDAPDLALQRGRTAINLMQTFRLITADEAQQALGSLPSTLSSQRQATNDQQAAPGNSIFSSLVLHQLEPLFSRDRITRGGLIVTTTLDYDLQQATSAAMTANSAVSRPAITIPGGAPTGDGFAAVGGQTVGTAPAPGTQIYGSGGIVSLAPDAAAVPSTANVEASDSPSFLILDPQSGQILAADGGALFFAAHEPGTLLAPFIYLTAFTRGFGPASLVWDIPPVTPGDAAASGSSQSASYHGPVRMRTALANDYAAATQSIAAQMGSEAIERTEASFGLGRGSETLLDMASAYAVFAANGVRYGLPGPSAVLRVEGLDHSVWLDLSNPQAQPIVAPPLAYLIDNVLSDEAARWPSLGHPNELEIGRPAGIKLGESTTDAWAIGYTPTRLVATWQALSSGSATQSAIDKRQSSISLLSALLQLSTASLPADGWAAPTGITSVDVCDPSGLLPTRDCPTTVTEVFLSGNEPAQSDTLFRSYTVNRETGLLATVFTPPELVENKVYMLVPAEAQDWAKAAGIPVAPTSFDAIQAPAVNPDVHISTPAMFSDVTGKVQFRGTASGADFDHYRILVGQGLNPQAWIQVGSDSSTRVEDGLLGTWDTSGLSGLYAVELQVIRTDQQIDTAIMQVTVR